jgi:hypothetical protein
LLKNGVEDAVVEWREAVLQRLAGVPLMHHIHRYDATHYIRRFLTPLHGVPLAAAEMGEEDAHGTLTLWFHENKDRNGNPSNRVYGVSNCHVLRKDTTVEYGTEVAHPRVTCVSAGRGDSSVALMKYQRVSLLMAFVPK